MGLIIRPNSKLRALQCRVFSWQALKEVYRREPIVIAWENISEILVFPEDKQRHFVIEFINGDGYKTIMSFFAEEVDNLSEFENYLHENPEKSHPNRYKFYKDILVESVKPNLRYGVISLKFIIGLLALSFMYFQFKYFGSLLIQKYQFLIKVSCNVQCAQQLWSISTMFFYVLMIFLAPVIPLLFYKKIYSAVARSKNVQVINSAITETILLAAVGLTILLTSSPAIFKATTRYSKVLAAYSDGSLQTKLSQKIEMASKREFQGDVDEIEEVEFLETQLEE